MLKTKTLAALLALLFTICAWPGFAQETDKSIQLDKAQILIGKLTDKRMCVAIQAAKLLDDAKETRAADALLGLLQSKDWQMRSAAAQALGKIGDKRAVDPIISLLGDQEVKSAVIGALGDLKARKAVKPLLALLKDEEALMDGSWTDAAAALGEIADPSTVPTLLKLMRTDDRSGDPCIMDAITAMGSAAVDPLLEALKDNDEQVRDWAVEALYQIGDKRAVEPLIDLLARPADVSLPLVAQGLMRLKDPRAIQPLGRIVLDPSIDPVVRCEVARCYGALTPPNALQVLAPLLQSEDQNLRQGAIDGLANCGDPRGVRMAFLAAQATSKPAESRDEEDGLSQWISETIEQLEKGPALDAWLELMRHSDLSIRRRIMSATYLGAGIGDGASAIVEEASKDPDPYIRSKVVRWLTDYDQYSAIDDEAILIRFADDPDDKIRYYVAGALSYRDTDASEAALAKLARDKQPYIRLCAIHGMAPAKHVMLLINLLRDREPAVRRSAAENLALAGDKRAVDPLTRLLNDKDSDVRLSAVCSLVTLGDYARIPDVIAAFSGESRFQMRRAYDCISKISDPKAASALRPFLKDESLHNLVALAMTQSGDSEAAKELVKVLKAQTAQDRAARQAAERACEEPDPGAEPGIDPSDEEFPPDVSAGEDPSSDQTEMTDDCPADSSDEVTEGDIPDEETSGETVDEVSPDEGIVEQPEEEPTDPMTDEMAQDECGSSDPAQDLDIQTIISALAVSHEPSAVKALLELVVANDTDYTGYAVIALGVMKDTSVVPDVIKLLDANNGTTRWEAAWILAQMDDDCARDALMTGLKEWDVEVVGGGATYFISNAIEAAIPVIADAVTVMDGECVDTESVEADLDLFDGCTLSGKRELVKAAKQWGEGHEMLETWSGDAAWGSPYPKWGVPVSRQPGTRSETAKALRWFSEQEFGE